MLPRQDQRGHTPACNDNSLFSCKRHPMPLSGIVWVATEVSGSVALSYVADGVLIITRQAA